MSVGVQRRSNRTEEAVTSAALTSKIKAKMALDDLVEAGYIDVDTDDGVVTLVGYGGVKGRATEGRSDCDGDRRRHRGW